jgi:hypothetical protein
MAELDPLEEYRSRRGARGGVVRATIIMPDQAEEGAEILKLKQPLVPPMRLPDPPWRRST